MDRGERQEREQCQRVDRRVGCWGDFPTSILPALLRFNEQGLARVREALFVEAERVGFEPTSRMNPLLVFETSSFNRSDTSPGTEPEITG